MKKILIFSTLFLASSLVLTGCTTTGIYNVNQHKVSGQKSSENVYRAIYAAGTSLGWRISKIKPGVAQGKISLRDHMAVIRIDYNNSFYTIRYIRSQNLNYNQKKGTIHKNNNGWIHNLENAIQNYL